MYHNLPLRPKVSKFRQQLTKLKTYSNRKWKSVLFLFKV